MATPAIESTPGRYLSSFEQETLLEALTQIHAADQATKRAEARAVAAEARVAVLERELAALRAGASSASPDGLPPSTQITIVYDAAGKPIEAVSVKTRHRFIYDSAGKLRQAVSVPAAPSDDSKHVVTVPK